MKDKFYFITGVFITCGIFIIIIVLFVFSKDLAIFHPSSTLHCYYHNVSGLKTGATVNLSGYHIGNVRNISFQDSGKILVEMDIMNEFLKYLYDDSVASIGTTGLLGDKAIYITMGQSGNPAKDGMTLSSKEPFEIGNALEDVSGVIGTLNKVLEDAQTITNKLATEYDTLVGSIEALTKIFNHIEDGKGNLGMLVYDDTLYTDLLSSVERINNTADNIEAFSSNINLAYKDLEKEFEGIGELVESLKLSGNNLYLGLKMFPEIMTDLTDIIEAAKFTFQGLQRNPLLGPFISVRSRTTEQTSFELLGE